LAPFLTGAVAGSGGRGASIGGALGGVGSAALSSAMGLTSGALTALGSTVSFALPVIGPIVGSLLGNWIGGLFGPSEGKLASQDRSAYIQQLGGNEAFNQQFRDAGVSGEQAAALTNQLMSQTTRSGVERTIAQINELLGRNTALLQEQRSVEAEIVSIEEQRKALTESLIPTWEQITAAAGRYGISIEGLGTQVNQLGQTETWTGMLNDIELLARAGGDMGGILVGMREEVSALVNESLRMGTEIPANMRPYIEELARSGQLLDANGEAITDLSGLRWGDPVATQADIVHEALAGLDELFASLNTRLEELIDALRNGLPNAAGTPIPTVRIPYEWEQRGDNPSGTDLPRMAAGGIVTRPTVALIGEAGPEAVVPLGGGYGLGTRVTVNVYGGYLDSPSTRQQLAAVVADEVERAARGRR